jgi:hypothetical protein
MSKGIGDRQRLFLDALRSLELQDRDATGAYFYVWAVVEQAWLLGPEIDKENYKDAQARKRVELVKAAALGDEAAKERLGSFDHRAALGQAINALFSNRRCGGRCLKRGDHGAEHELNPSRVLASLARRGLVERNAMQGYGATVKLTEEGRRIANA